VKEPTNARQALAAMPDPDAEQAPRFAV